MEDKKDPYDGEYVGNIFGWKISFIGLFVISSITALAAYRHITMDVPLGIDDPMEEQKARFAPPGKADREKAERERDTLTVVKE
ncbi:MAG: hypothetical protein ACJAZ9_001518 [Neolewinella sp.]|jgi:hypothetical protein